MIQKKDKYLRYWFFLDEVVERGVRANHPCKEEIGGRPVPSSKDRASCIVHHRACVMLSIVVEDGERRMDLRFP